MEQIKHIVELPEKINISRNGVIWPLTKTTVLRGPNEGQVYWTPEEPNEETLAKYVKWTGTDWVTQVLSAKDKQISQNIFGQVLQEDQESIDYDKFISYHTERSVRGETKGRLIELQDEANAKLHAVMLRLNQGEHTPEESQQLLIEGMKYTKLAQEYAAEIERKTRERAPRGSKKQEAESEAENEE